MGKLTINDIPSKQAAQVSAPAKPTQEQFKVVLPIVVKAGHEKYDVIDAVFVLDTSAPPNVYDKGQSIAVARASWEKRLKVMLEKIRVAAFR